MNNNVRLNRSLLNFFFLTIVASLVTIYLLKKTEEGISEVDSLTQTPYYSGLRYIKEDELGPVSVSSSAVYRSPGFGFEVAYPADWQPEERLDEVGFKDPKRAQSGYRGDAASVRILIGAREEEAVGSAFFVKEGDKYFAIGRFGGTNEIAIQKTVGEYRVIIGHTVVGVFGEEQYLGLADNYRALISYGTRHAIIDVVGAQEILDRMIATFKFMQ